MSALRTPSEDEWVDAPLVMWVLRSGGETVVVDTGASTPGSPAAARHHYAVTRPAPEEPLEALRRLGVDPSEVTNVILTHTHWDHSSNTGLFPNATVHIQTLDMQASVEPPPGQDLAFESPTIGMEPPWSDSFDRVSPVMGDLDLLDGVQIRHAPGHTPGSQIVIVATAEGKHIIAGDLVALSSNLRPGDRRLPGLIASEADAERSLDMLESLGGRVLPSHDPGLFTGHDGIVAIA